MIKLSTFFLCVLVSMSVFAGSADLTCFAVISENALSDTTYIKVLQDDNATVVEVYRRNLFEKKLSFRDEAQDLQNLSLNKSIIIEGQDFLGNKNSLELTMSSDQVVSGLLTLAAHTHPYACFYR